MAAVGAGRGKGAQERAGLEMAGIRGTPRERTARTKQARQTDLEVPQGADTAHKLFVKPAEGMGVLPQLPLQVIYGQRLHQAAAHEPPGRSLSFPELRAKATRLTFPLASAGLAGAAFIPLQAPGLIASPVFPLAELLPFAPDCPCF